MSKGLIAFIVVAAVALMIIIMKESAHIARTKSDEIMEQFKTIDRDLQNTTDERLDSLNKILLDSLGKANKQ
jgi:archaellin